MYAVICTNILSLSDFFFIDCDIWFMQIYFITRIFSAFDDTFMKSRTMNDEERRPKKG